MSPHEFGLKKAMLTQDELDLYPAHAEEVAESYGHDYNKMQYHACDLCRKYGRYLSVKRLIEDYLLGTNRD